MAKLETVCVTGASAAVADAAITVAGIAGTSSFTLTYGEALTYATTPATAVSCGIPAIDLLLGGGFRYPSSVLLEGGKGVGKSALIEKMALGRLAGTIRVSVYDGYKYCATDAMFASKATPGSLLLVATVSAGCDRLQVYRHDFDVVLRLQEFAKGKRLYCTKNRFASVPDGRVVFGPDGSARYAIPARVFKRR